MIQISCIVPFYNEGPRICSTLDELVKSTYIDEFIAVDDGSTDRPVIDIRTYREKFKLVQIDHNLGKSDAVYKGLKQVRGTIILLVDADYKDLKIQEIDVAIKKYIEHPNLDMLILRSTTGTWITRVCRQDIVLSGFRILKKVDLENVYKTNPRGYQIETAINTYMTEHKKKVLYTEFTGRNTVRNQKIGLLPGFIGLILLLYDVYSYRGYIRYLRQLWTFCKWPVK